MALITDIGIPGLGGTGNGILHPKQQYRWRVTFSSFAGGVLNSDDISFQAINFTRPQLSFAEVELHRYNSRGWIGGKHNWETSKLTIEDDISSRATRVIQEQLQNQQYLIGGQGPWMKTAREGSDYKFATKLDMLDGNDATLESWVMEGCWLKEVKWGDLDYSKSDAVTIDLTIRFDNARQYVFQYGGSGSALGGNTPSMPASI